MGRIKDIFKGEHRRFAWFTLIIMAIFIVKWLFGPGTTVVHWLQAVVRINRQENTIKELKIENAILDKKIKMLKHDRDTLEKFARENFHFAAPGDDVYLIQE